MESLDPSSVFSVIRIPAGILKGSWTKEIERTPRVGALRCPGSLDEIPSNNGSNLPCENVLLFIESRLCYISGGDCILPDFKAEGY